MVNKESFSAEYNGKRGIFSAEYNG